MAGIERPNMADATPTEIARGRIVDQAVQNMRSDIPNLGAGIPILRPAPPEPEPEPPAPPEPEPELSAAQMRRVVAIEKASELDQIRVFIGNLNVQVQAGQPLSAEQQIHQRQAEARRNEILQSATFEESLFFGDTLQNPEDVQAARVRRDRLLTEAQSIGRTEGKEGLLFDVVKDSLVSVYYGSRVKVANKEKAGRDEFEGRGTLEKLAILRGVARNSEEVRRLIADDRTGRIAQIIREGNIFQGEDITEFWSSPELQRLEVDLIRQNQDPDIKERGDLARKYRGVVDYFNQESLDMIAEVVKNRKSFQAGYQSQLNEIGYGKGWQVLADSWNCKVVDDRGNPVKDEVGRPLTAGNFDELRALIEEERRKEPWVPNRGDYETWINFVADDAEELEEMIPYILTKIGRKLGTGEPNSVYQTLQQEKEKMDKALAVFPTESETQFRRLKSILTANLNLMGAQFFSDLVRKDWQPYEHYMEFLATSFQDTERQDHFVDAVLLDRDGLTMLALEEYAKDDGKFWRYNQDETDKTGDESSDTGALLRAQQRRRVEIERFLMNKRLKTLDELAPDGNPVHPAFIRLKAKLDHLDAGDPERNNAGFTTRWEEYRKKFKEWEATGQFDDPRDQLQRVIFQHPLARAFREEQVTIGDITEQNEFSAMFTDDEKVIAGGWHEREKRSKALKTMDKSEKVIRAFMQDSLAALARHTPKKREGIDEIKWIQMYAPDLAASMKADGTDAIPHITLVRAMAQTALREDRMKSPDQMRFKLHYILTEKLGLDIDQPLFAAWNLGAHDTFRPTLLRYINEVPELRTMLEENQRRRDAGEPDGMDRKTTIARWAEDERRFKIALEFVIKQMVGSYFNFPGHDTAGAGVKDIRNALAAPYGISRDTVEINGLINDMWFGESTFPEDYGCTRSPFRQLVGLYKGPDEVVFAETGGMIENPRDPEAWVKRFFKGVVSQMQMFTRGEKDSHGLLNDGPISGAYRFRARNRTAANYEANIQKDALERATLDPDSAYDIMLEGSYESYVDTAIKVAGPLMAVMSERMNSVDSTYGRNPGSAMFLNTLLWYAVSKWMDTRPDEFRAKFGFAYDVDLSLARIFIRTALYESRLIYDDKQWDEIMVGYSRVEKNIGGIKRIVHVMRYKIDGDGNTEALEDIKDGDVTVVRKGEKVKGEIHGGVIDSFPEGLKQLIINKKWLPYGLDSTKPESLDVLTTWYEKEGSKRTKEIYKKVRDKSTQLAGGRIQVTR